MSELILVRHGQASFGSANYDKLSDMGIRQAQILAEYWQDRDETFDHIYSGSLLRQIETATPLLPMLCVDSPQIKTHEGFNEYHATPLLDIYLRDHVEIKNIDNGTVTRETVSSGTVSLTTISLGSGSFGTVSSQNIVAEPNPSRSSASTSSGTFPPGTISPGTISPGTISPGTTAKNLDKRFYQPTFEAATDKWIKDELIPSSEDSGFEKFSDFQTRVYNALDDVMKAHGKGSRVLISTSGGVIAMALQKVLNFPDEQVIATNWMIKNSSITTIQYGGGRMSLTGFNAVPHLDTIDHRGMISYK